MATLSLSPSGPNRGHYITIVKSHGYWLLFDDDIVEVRLQTFFVFGKNFTQNIYHCFKG